MVTWDHLLDDLHYELEVWNGSAWISLVKETSNYTAKSYNYTVASTFPDTKEMKFRVRSWDSKKLHSADWSTGSDIICDSTKPIVTLTPTIPNTTYTPNPVTVNILATDGTAGIVKLVVTKNGVETVTPYLSLDTIADSVLFSENGTVTVTATDACGNVSTLVSYQVKNIDTDFPTVAASVKVKGVDYSGPTNYPIDFTMTFGDTGVSGLAKREYALTESIGTPLANEWKVSATNVATERCYSIRHFHLYMRATDKAGNETLQYFGEYIIDNTNPTARSFEVKVVEGKSVKITLSGTENDPGDFIKEFKIRNQPTHGTLSDVSKGVYLYTHRGDDPVLDDSFDYYVVDSRDGESLDATVTLKVQPVNDPPEIKNLQPVYSVNWNETLLIPFDIFDPDNDAVDLALSVRSGNTAIISNSSMSATVTPQAEVREGAVSLSVTPEAWMLTEVGKPVVLTIRLKDPDGAIAEKKVEVNVLRTPQPPVAKDHYFFVADDGSVTGFIAATPDPNATIDSYTFGSLQDPGQGTLTPDSSVPNKFKFTAVLGFTGTRFQVIITDSNNKSTPIWVYLSPTAVSNENERVDRLVSTIPGFDGVDTTTGNVVLEIVKSSDETILRAGDCDFLLDPDGTVQLLYEPVSYQFGDVLLTIRVMVDGTEKIIFDIPISIKPVNDAPEVKNQVTSPLASDPYRAFSALGTGSRSLANPVYSIYSGNKLVGSLIPDDSLDLGYACNLFSIECLPGFAPEHGTLQIDAAGNYTYTPDRGFVGTDVFYVLVSELEGDAANKNPAQLPSGIRDVSSVAPMLARVVAVRINVVPIPLPQPETSSSNEETPVAGGGNRAPFTQNPNPNPPVFGGGSGSGGSPSGNTPPLVTETNQRQPSGQMGVRRSAINYRWPVIGLLLVLLLMLFLLLFTCRIHVTYEWWEEGTKKRHKSVRHFLRIRHPKHDVLYLDITKDDMPPLSEMSATIHFGPVYRRDFYERPVVIHFENMSLITEIPPKKEYREIHLAVNGSHFTVR